MAQVGLQGNHRACRLRPTPAFLELDRIDLRRCVSANTRWSPWVQAALATVQQQRFGGVV
jgi:hypothetical protein